jgi:hypothetical protein
MRKVIICPQCGTETREALKFFNQCGVNLRRVQGVLSKGGGGSPAHIDRVDWEREALEEYREKRQKSPEEKRLLEIKAGVITTCAGLAIMIFLSFLGDAIANNISDQAANVMRSIWAAGLVPFLVGLAILFNGYFISKKIVDLKRQQKQDNDQSLFPAPQEKSTVPRLPASRLEETPSFAEQDYSVTESTTSKLREPR